MRISQRPILVSALAIALPLLASCHSSSHSSASASAAELSPIKKWEFNAGALAPLCKGCYRQEQILAIGADGTLYVPGARGLYALNPDGTQKWFHDDPYQSRYVPVRFSLVDDNGNIWFDDTVDMGKQTGGVIEVDPSGHELPGAVSRDPVTQLGEAYDGKVFVAMGDAMMVSIPIDGSSRPRRDAPITGHAFAFAQNGSIYSTGQALAAFSPDAFIGWIQNVPAGGYPALASDGTIYVGANGLLAAVNPDGTGKWSFTLPGQLAFSPSIAPDGTVYFGCDDHNVYAVGPDGRLKWKFGTGAAVRSTPAIAKTGTIYFGSLDNNLYAVGADGKLKWKFATRGQVFSPTIADDGTIYFQNGEGKLFAIQDTEENGGMAGQWPKLFSGPRNTARGVH
jgi:outer membrane protein assembly factor BamB